MSKLLRAAFIDATETARCTLGDLAAAIDRSYRALTHYRSGKRRVTPEVALTLSAHLRRRARALSAAADRLEAVADREKSKPEDR